MRIISYQLIERGYKKKDKVEILELKSTITEINNSLEGLNSKVEEEERINELEDKSFEIIQSEYQKENRMKKSGLM